MDFEQAVIDALPVAFIVADTEGRYRVFNAAAERLLGGRPGPADRPGSPTYIRAFHPDGVTPMTRAEIPLIRALAGETLLDLRLVIVNAVFPEGKHIISSSGPVRDADGRIIAGVTVMHDVTKQVADEGELHAALRRTQELSALSRLKSDFIAHMSHELRTPLNAIIGFASLLERGKAGAVDATQREYLGDILAGARELLALINNVLDLSKIEAGKIELHRSDVDLGASIHEVHGVVRGLAGAKHLRLLLDLDPATPPVRADPDQIKQVLYNLVSNAIGLTPDRGSVTVRLAPRGAREVGIDIEDTGPGIPADDLPKLFVEYEQVGRAGRAHPGAGLGLALTRRIVDAHGGSLTVSSTLGVGSVFSVALPV